MASNGLSKIQHIVVLMLENRSFDNMLGFLYADRGNVSPLGHPFEGLTGKETNPAKGGKQVQVFGIKKDDPLKGLTPPTSKQQPPASKEPTHLETAVAQTMATLPVGADEKGDVHQHDIPACETGAQCMAYARKRYRAFYKNHEKIEKRSRRS